MVPSRNTVPMAMRTIGAENERRYRGGGTWTGLAISHLTRRHLDIAGHAARRPRWRRQRRWWRWWRLALQQLGYANGQQKDGPGTVPAWAIHVLKQRKASQRDQHNRPDKSAPAAVAGVRIVPGTNHPPANCKHPHPEPDQKEGPDAIPSELENARGLQQEQDAQTNQNHGGRGNPGTAGRIGRFCHRFSGFRICSESLSQPKRVGCWLPHLDGLGGTNRVDNLPHVKERDPQAQNRIQSCVIGNGLAPHQERESHQVGQPLRILSAVNRAYSERKEAGQNARQGGIRPGVRHDWRGDGRSETGRRRCRCGLDALQPLGQAVLAIDHTLHLPGATGAQRLAAGAAVRDRRNIWMIGAVHENLLCVASITTGGSLVREASITWLPSWL